MTNLATLSNLRNEVGAWNLQRSDATGTHCSHPLHQSSLHGSSSAPGFRAGTREGSPHTAARPPLALQPSSHPPNGSAELLLGGRNAASGVLTAAADHPQRRRSRRSLWRRGFETRRLGFQEEHDWCASLFMMVCRPPVLNILNIVIYSGSLLHPRTLFASCSLCCSCAGAICLQHVAVHLAPSATHPRGVLLTCQQPQHGRRLGLRALACPGGGGSVGCAAG